MHTSTVISSPDFQYWKIDSEDGSQVKFEGVCPAYHEQDRTAVVVQFWKMASSTPAMHFWL